MKITTKILVACLPAIVTGALFAASSGEAASRPNAAAMTKAKNALAQLPLSFEPNRGQTDPRVQYLSRGPGYTVFFTPEETVMSLKDTKTSNAVVRMKFVGGTNSAIAQPIDQLPSKTNYLVGNDSSKWLTGLPEYTSLRYANIYPGIDVLYQGDQQKLRYDFILKPGADPRAIQMAFEGAENVSLTKDGDLALTIDGKTLVTTKPYTYQEQNGTKKEIASHFVVKNGHVTFELAKYDTTKDVVIDPIVNFVTYLGGTLNDSVNGVAIVNPTLSFASGPTAYFVTGTTISPNFPLGGGAAAPPAGTGGIPTCTGNNIPAGCDSNGLNGNTLAGNQDVFVSEFSITGTLKWSTYIGGNNQDIGTAIATDIAAAGCAAGCPVVVGQTFSANFPTLPFQANAGNPGAPGLQGSNDAFAVKLNATGTAFIYSVYLGGIADDQATGVAIAEVPTSTGVTVGDVFVGGYTDSPLFIGNATANHGLPTTSSDAFIVKIPSSYPASGAITSVLYGGFGEEFAHAIAYNNTNGMVYLAGDTTTATQNFIAPNNKNLPGLTNNTANTGLAGAGAGTGGTTARGGFVVAFDGATLVQTFGTYVSIDPAGSNNLESITGVAAEGGAPAAACSAVNLTCTVTTAAAAPIAAGFGNIGHIYITGVTTSSVPSGNVARVVPSFACLNPLAASSLNKGTSVIGPNGVTITTPGGTTQPSGCTTSLITEAPFNTNTAVTAGCQFPLNTDNFVPTPTCNLAAFVAILDGALITNPAAVAGLGVTTCTTNNSTPSATCAPIGNQIEYWAYYSSANASTSSKAIAIDVNPTTASATYSLGTYQQMYITGSTQLTSGSPTVCLGAAQGFPAGTPPTTVNCLPMTNVITPQVAGTNNSTFGAPSEVFWPYNVGTTTGGGVGGYDPFPNPGNFNPVGGNVNEIDAFMARFNANGLAASTYGGQGATAATLPAGTITAGNDPAVFPFMGYGLLPAPLVPNDHSQLIHTPQLNFGEYLYATATQDASSTPNTVGNSIAVDVTRATLIGGATNVSNNPGSKACIPASVCNFATSNAALVTNSGGIDGWVSAIFFNDILTNASAQASANPWLTPTNPLLQPTAAGQANTNNCTSLGNCSYIETTPAPFGPTFDFAISDASTQTQTFQVLFTGQAAGLLVGTTPFYIPQDPRSGATSATLDNNEPGSGVAYYIPCLNPVTTSTGGLATASKGYFNNAYPAPGGAYGPQTCAFPGSTPAGAPSVDLYADLPMLFSGWPGLTNLQANATLVAPGWLVVSQDINPGVVRMQLDRRAAAGLLEGTYVAQFLVTTLDPNEGIGSHPIQWPPCGPQSSLNPYVPTASVVCQAANTQLPADNISILVTVRLIVRPTLFLSRNSGALTGVTSSLANNPLFGPNIGNNVVAQGLCNNTAFAGPPAVACPATDIIIQQGTAQVPDWWYTGGPGAPGGSATHGNDIATWPNGVPAGLGSIFLAGNAGVNSAQGTCLSGTVAGVFVPNQFNLPPVIGQIGNFTTATPSPVALPCPVYSAVLQDTWGTGTNAIQEGNAAYLGNGPGDVPSAVGTTPNSTPTMTFLYDVGTVLSITPTAGSTACSKFAADPTNSASANECNLSIEQNLAPYRPDQPSGVATFNASWQGGQDPLTQRNDATVHDYYVTAEGQATLSVAAINCTGWGLNGVHNNNIGNWLAVQVGGVTVNTLGAPNPSNYTPICTDLSSTTIGTVRAPVTSCPASAHCTYSTAINDDEANPGAIGGQKITLDFLTKGFSGGCLSQSADAAHGSTTCVTAAGFAGPREAFNGIPTGFYSATVFVWSTRAKNVVPGYCLGASFPASSVADGSDPVPLCPGTAATQTNVASSTNPNPEVLVQGVQMFNVNLFVFDTTQVIQITPNSCPTNGIVPGQTIPLTDTVGESENIFTGNISCVGAIACGPGSTPNYPNFGPQINSRDTVVWSLTPWTPSTPGLLSCALPPGGASIAGVGTLNNPGPISETSFTAASSFLNTSPSATVTFYACRPTIAPAFLAQPNFQEDPVKFPPYPAAFLGVSAPVPSLASQTCSINPVGSTGGGVVMSGSRVGVVRGSGAATTFNFDSNGNGIGPSPNDPLDRVDSFAPPGGVQAGDVPVIGDWNGDGHAKAGWFRPTTAQWWLDVNNDGAFTAGVDASYTFGFGAGDIPVSGDWAGIGKSCIGLQRNGFLWVLDLNCDGVFQQPAGTPVTGDAVFTFGSAGGGGIAADFPIAGNWFGNVNATTGKPITQIGAVRPFSAGGGPALWLLDSGLPGTVAGNVAGGVGSPTAQAGHAIGNLPGVAFGGMPGDMPIVGDWYNTGVAQFGDFAQGFLWVLDGAPANAPQASQFNGFVFPYGGLPGDKPIVGKW